jgi:hypothetical protein
LADAVEFIESKLDVQTDDVGQMLAQERMELRAQYMELKRDTIDIYKCISDATSLINFKVLPLQLKTLCHPNHTSSPTTNAHWRAWHGGKRTWSP